jgi:bifunctional DNase/RNase
MTYQFAANLLAATDWRVREVRISALAAGTFYAQVILEHQSEERAIDARPSDALNLALLSNAPVQVDSTLFEECAAIDTPDWRNYQTTVPDLAAEVRQTNERIREWLQARHHDAEPGGAQPSAT